jgi:hypothetical protein
LRRFGLAIVVFTLLAGALPGYAATVAILSNPTPSPPASETLARIHGELLSLGLDVVMTDRATAPGPTTADSRDWLLHIAVARKAIAVIDIIDEDAAVAVDVWVVKSPLGRFEVTRVAIEPNAPNAPNASGRLALRAIEALRASLLEIDLAARQRQEEMLAKPATTELPDIEVNAAVARAHVALEVGAAAVGGRDGLGPLLLPVLQASWEPRTWLALQAAFAGMGTRAKVATGAGSARVAERYGMVGARCRLRSNERVWPFLALAAGALRTSVEGEAGPAGLAHVAHQWSLILDGSAGAGLRVYGRTYLTLALHVRVAEPYVAIHVLDTVAGTTGRPDFLLTLTVGAWL